MEVEFKRYIALLQSTGLEERKIAITYLEKWNRHLDWSEVKWLLQLAARIKPISKYDWDDPSYVLLQVASISLYRPMVNSIRQHFQQYSGGGKSKALEILWLLQIEESRTLLYTLLDEWGMKTPLYINTDTLFHHGNQVKSFIHFLTTRRYNEHDWYRNYFYYNLNRAYKECVIDKDEIVPHYEEILSALHQTKMAYQVYDRSFTKKNAYESWKDSYFELRSQLLQHVSLLTAFSWSDVSEFFQESLLYRDPYVRAKIIVLLWSMNEEVAQQHIETCLYDEMAVSTLCEAIITYDKWEVVKDKQRFEEALVFSVGFDCLLHHEEYGMFPKKMRIEKRYERSLPFLQPNYYYLVSFYSDDPSWENEGHLRMIIGGFPVEHFPSTDITEQTFTDFVRWEGRTADQHFKELYNDVIHEDYEKRSEDIYYESSLEISSWYVVFAFFFGANLFLQFGHWSVTYFVNVLLFIGNVSLIWRDITLQKNIAVRVKTFTLEYITRNRSLRVPLQDIALVTMKKKYRFGVFFNWYVVGFNDDGKELFSIKKQFIDEDAFGLILEQQLLLWREHATVTWMNENDKNPSTSLEL